jgi:predicted ATP-binding protein involved in virulence
MYIERIDIENIRIIEKFEIIFRRPFNGWHVIIGDNGSGKSSFIRSVALALVGPMQAPALRANWRDWLRWNCDEGTISLTIEKDDNHDKQTGKSAPLKNYYINNNILFFSDENGKVGMESNYNLKGKDIKGKNYIDPARYNWGNGEGWFSVAYGPFRRFTGGNPEWNKIYYSSPKVGAHLSVFGEDIALTEALEWIKELDYKRLKEKEYSDNSNESQSIFDNIKSFINNSGLLPHKATFDRVDELPVFKDGNGNLISVTQLSDGYRSILSLTFELIRQLIRTYGHEVVFENINTTNQIILPGVVLIDEIDAHLHPTWQTRIGEWFTTYFPKLQFIVTTHSPLICRACEKGTIWRLTSPGSDIKSGEITGSERDKLIFGNVLDAYGTEVFGKSPVRSEKSEKKLEKLGQLNILSALGKITDKEENERLELQKILSTDAPVAH